MSTNLSDFLIEALAVERTLDTNFGVNLLDRRSKGLSDKKTLQFTFYGPIA
jgi:hypothetical protein